MRLRRAFARASGAPLLEGVVAALVFVVGVAVVVMVVAVGGVQITNCPPVLSTFSFLLSKLLVEKHRERERERERERDSETPGTK